MMMKRVVYIASMLLILSILYACSPSPSPEEEVRNFYMEYVEACKEDRMNATIQYVHFEDETDRKVAELNAQCTLLCTDVLSIERLSNDLWVIYIYYENLYVPDGNYTHHFVGVIDGEYKVMRSVRNIPSDLKQDLSFEQYMPTGDFVSHDEVIIPNE